MNSENQNPQQVDIPKIFKCDLTGDHFDHCIHCERELLDGSVPYVIEKAIKPYNGYKAYSTIFEYAMCMPCAVGLRSKISKESMENINHYFSTQINFVERAKVTFESENVDDYMKQCLIKNRSIDEVNECQIYAQCQGDKMTLGEFPYMVSGQAMDEVMDLLSQETMDEFNDLKDELIDGPSEFQDLLQGGPRVLI
ncbi:hypothetical protein [Reichenbachiella versicolor]|uniref:hypothetical protein n=1 Tax=Reichenbachiella versicolor TaxID=1821036 RepID=UPI000D6DFC1E|nr:hypothetical protein [Reichenbachiella versicolor]